MLVYLTILKLQYVLFEQTHSKHFIPYFFTQKGIPLNHIKTIFSLLATKLYFMSNMQWNMDFCSLKNFSK
jgi:hypothetical protein